MWSFNKNVSILCYYKQNGYLAFRPSVTNLGLYALCYSSLQNMKFWFECKQLDNISSNHQCSKFTQDCWKTKEKIGIKKKIEKEYTPSHRLSNKGLSQYKTTSFCFFTESHWVDSVMLALAKILLSSSFTTFINNVVKKYFWFWFCEPF